MKILPDAKVTKVDKKADSVIATVETARRQSRQSPPTG